MKSVVREAFLRQTTKWPLREQSTLQTPPAGPFSDYAEPQSGPDEIFAFDKDTPVYSSATQRMNQNQSNDGHEFEDINLTYPPANPNGGDAENPKISFQPKKRWRFFRSGNNETPEAFQDIQLRSFFFSKVMGVKSMEFFLLSLIICMFQQHPTFEGTKWLIENHTYMYIPFIVWLIFQVFVRFVCIRCSVPAFFLVLGHILIMITSGLFCTSVALTHHTDAILIASIIITSSLGFMALTPFLVSIDVFKLKMFGLALLGVIVTSLCLIMTPLLSTTDNSVLTVWLPGILMAQLFIMVCLFEIQLVMKGSRFKINQSDWLYAALYV